MATKTSNYEFNKPEQNDFYDVDVQNENWDKVDEELSEFDDSGVTEDIKSFPDFLSKFVTGNKVAITLRNLKAGLQFVLHAGQIVNNCVTDNPNMPLSAAQGKALMDLYTKLNSDMEYHDVAVTLNTDVINECTIHCRRNGTVAAISVNGINGSNAINPGEIYTIATGLPPCSLEFQDLTVEIDVTATSVHKRAWVNNQGALFFVTTESNYTGNIFIGGTYACQ